MFTKKPEYYDAKLGYKGAVVFIGSSLKIAPVSNRVNNGD